MKKKELLMVGELAEKMGITVRTLQYYDKEGLLRPSATSVGGRRLYTQKDMVKLHQILSMKFLGFSLAEIKNQVISLDTAAEVLQVLEQQKRVIEQQIVHLSEAHTAISLLQAEVGQMQEVDFSKYADIVALLRQKNDAYWVVKLLDDKLLTHIKERYTGSPEQGAALFERWQRMCDDTLWLQEQGVAPGSEEGQQLVAQWWAMVMDFTGGDLEMLPELIKFDRNKQGWTAEMQAKQNRADAFIGEALQMYLQNQGIGLPELEAQG
ncbi:MerR family transcriptional regulator [Paenibacillus donghaensis]|uniref:MerR family transcriptional regulator n=1 Tax=Paenibacillus donghaensis TaxID=414771 RepID=A0A2Z2KAJ8_9BACL|nr:MerR family transcriptional regulator [Paenibacillus donghaensis]ASA20605.1 MerR family transcriptional regulator [Paenibacillus donghaensis]